MDDAVEIPIQRCLYRQSSVEQRLSPVHLSEESNSESEEEETKQKPAVVSALLKDSTKEQKNKEEKANNEAPEKQKSDRVQTKSNFNVKPVSKLINSFCINHILSKIYCVFLSRLTSKLFCS